MWLCPHAGFTICISQTTHIEQQSLQEGKKVFELRVRRQRERIRDKEREGAKASEGKRGIEKETEGGEREIHR